jgi:hypothetical protein
MRIHTAFAALTLTAGLSAWTVAGETFSPTLAVRELPLEIVNGCVSAAALESAHAACVSGHAFTSRWVGRSARGNLFLVVQAPCTGGECRGWLVEKTGQGTSTLLTLSGEFRLERDSSAYPVVFARQALSETQSHLSRFEWHGGRYVRAEGRLLYHIDGVECGGPEECSRAAREALRKKQVDRALRIYERVHGVSWI